MTHRIRLHGPWRLSAEPTGDSSPALLKQTLAIPADWSDCLPADFCGQVVLQRRFGTPTNLSSQTQLSLVFEEILGTASVRINGQWVVTAHPSGQRLELKLEPSTLLANNELRVEIEGPVDPAAHSAQAGGITGSVYLQIQENSQE